MGHFEIPSTGVSTNRPRVPIIDSNQLKYGPGMIYSLSLSLSFFCFGPSSNWNDLFWCSFFSRLWGWKTVISNFLASAVLYWYLDPRATLDLSLRVQVPIYRASTQHKNGSKHRNLTCPRGWVLWILRTLGAEPWCTIWPILGSAHLLLVPTKVLCMCFESTGIRLKLTC